MRNRHDPLTKRLLAWGWVWGDKLEREGVPTSLPCTLGADGASATVPGSRIFLAPHDWLPKDVIDIQRAYETLIDYHREVVWLHYVYPHVPVKRRCDHLAICSSVYYQRLDYARAAIRKVLNRRAGDMELFHMERLIAQG